MGIMNEVINIIGGLKKKIRNSSGCSYLYSYFDDLVHELDLFEKNKIPTEVLMELLSLIRDYAADSIYDTHSSANWVRYSARCFYCADYLMKYLTDPLQQTAITSLEEYFHRLTEAGVAPVLPNDVVVKYIEIGKKSNAPIELYDYLIKKAIDGGKRFRLWNASEVGLALQYLRSVDWLIHQYISIFSDCTMLKVWVPLMNTTKLADVWYEYPDSHEYRHFDRYARAAVSRYLDEMLDIHLSIIELWYWNNPQEMIDELPLDDLIEALEVYDDDEFEKTLRHMVTLPYHEKIEKILDHFTDDDEHWIVNLSINLLNNYKKE